MFERKDTKKGHYEGVMNQKSVKSQEEKDQENRNS